MERLWWCIDISQSSALELCADDGRMTVFVGPNGGGKSSLAFHLNEQAPEALRLLGHRQIWFKPGVAEKNSSEREKLRVNAASGLRNPASRYRDDVSVGRTSVVLSEMSARVNQQARADSKLARTGKFDHETAEPTLLDRLNSVMQDCGLKCIQLGPEGEIEVACGQADESSPEQAGESTYPAFQMSDGEKSALQLSVEVLLADPNSVLILDEPERHLHPSISRKLISSLRSLRTDCHFVLFTHDLGLVESVIGQEDVAVVHVASVTWDPHHPGNPIYWDVNSVSALPDQVRYEILGARPKVAFVEGKIDGIDDQLWNAILQEQWHVHASDGGYEEVLRNTTGLRNSSEFGWIEAVGIVDRDNRDAAQIASLESRGVAVLGVDEIENVYFTKPVRDALASAQASALSEDASALERDAIDATLEAVGRQVDHLASVAASRFLRRFVIDAIPDELSADDDEVEIVCPNPLAEHRDRLELLIQTKNLHGVLEQFSVRNSSAPAVYASRLRYKDFDTLRAAANQLIRKDAELRAEVAALVLPDGLPARSGSGPA